MRAPRSASGVITGAELELTRLEELVGSELEEINELEETTVLEELLAVLLEL